MPTDFLGIFRKRLQFFLPYFNTRLLYSIQQTKIGEVQANLKKGQWCVLAIDSAGVWAGHGSTLLSTVQTPVPNQHNMATPYWDNGGFPFLQWKCHESGCHSPHFLHHTTAAHHPWTASPIIHCTHTFPSTAVTNHSFALIVSPHLHLIHTHTFKQQTSMQTLRSVVLALADISERYPSCWLLSLCLTPDCPTLEL